MLQPDEDHIEREDSHKKVLRYLTFCVTNINHIFHTLELSFREIFFFSCLRDLNLTSVNKYDISTFFLNFQYLMHEHHNISIYIK